MDFKQLESFVTVVRYESFTKAAAKLGISQPTVSTHIRMLEEELGMPLVLRISKHVELTPKGRKVYDQAISMLSMRERMIETIRAREKNTIYLGASSIPSAYLLPHIMKAYNVDHPETNFVIYQGDSQDIISGLSEGIYDVGLVGMKADDDLLECVPFAQDRLVFATPNTEKYRHFEPSAENIKDALKSENVLLRREGSASRSMVDRIFDALDIDERSLHV